MRVQRHRLFALVAGIAGCCVAGSAHGAYVLTTPSSIITENFNTFQGTNNGTDLPNFTLVASSPGNNGLFTDDPATPSAYSTNNGFWAGVSSAGSADHNLSLRVPGSATATATFTVTNNTGQTLTAGSLTVAFNVESYEDYVASPNTISITSDNGGGGVTFNQTNLTGAGLITTSSDGAGGAAASGYASPHQLASNANDAVSYNLTVPNGTSVQFQFQWAPGVTGGNRPIWGPDDLVISAPEPASIGVVALGSFGLLSRRRRRA